MKKAIFASVVLATSILSLPSAYAGCNFTSLSNQPSIPKGDSATYMEMQASRQRVEQYIANAEKQLKNCGFAIDSFRHNFYVHKLQNVAEQFNTELNTFQKQ